MRGLARIRTKLAGTNGTARAADRKRIASLEQKVERLKRSSDTELMKVLRRGYAAGPLVPMGYPGAELQLVAAAQNRQDEHESEPYISTWIERCFTPDDVFYDIGANVGTYSLIAASVALPEGRAFAFEPSFSTYAVLCENVFVNGLGERIATLPVALGATTGLETFHYSSIRPGAAKHNWPTGEVAYSHEVLSYRLDDLVRQLDLPLPRHIKIDVDGGEPDLLRGAAGVLSSSSLQTLIVELLPWTREAVVEELAGHGFALIHTYERPPSPVSCGLFARSEGGLTDRLDLGRD